MKTKIVKIVAIIILVIATYGCDTNSDRKEISRFAVETARNNPDKCVRFRTEVYFEPHIHFGLIKYIKKIM